MSEILVKAKTTETLLYEEMLRGLDSVCKDTKVTAAVAKGYPFRVTFAAEDQPTLLDDFEQAKQGRARVAVIVDTDTLIIADRQISMTKSQMKKLIKYAEDLASMWFLAFVSENWTQKIEEAQA